MILFLIFYLSDILDLGCCLYSVYILSLLDIANVERFSLADFIRISVGTALISVFASIL